MVLTRFQWRYGGRQVFLVGSFTSWSERHQMVNAESNPSVFQTVCELPVGLYQYRFLVDNVWRFDEQQFCVPGDHGMLNNVLLVDEPNVLHPVPHFDPYMPTSMRIDEVIPVYMAQPSFSPPGPIILVSNAEIQAFRNWISTILSNIAMYDILPPSSKVFAVSAQLPVKQAFHVMHDEGLAVVPIWDDGRENVTGMLTASDFILILQELQKNAGMLTNEELEMHPVSDWKEGKIRLYRQNNDPIGLNLRPLIHVSETESLRNVALKLLQNEISAVPMFRSKLQDSTCFPLLNVASLPVILRYICSRIGDVVDSGPFLQYPVCRMPVGTWKQEMGRGGVHHLIVLKQSMPFNTALNVLLEARISSIPVVDDNEALIDVYARSDIISLAKDDAYAYLDISQITIGQALEFVYLANPQITHQRRCPTCFQSTPFFEVLHQLSNPDARRVVIIDHFRKVEGVISLRDIVRYFLG